MLPLPTVSSAPVLGRPYRNATLSSRDSTATTANSSIDSSFRSAQEERQRKTARSYPLDYLRRAFHFRQIDWEFAVAQMICLCISPKKVYQFVEFRKQTKNTWARDDPGFIVMLLFLLIGTAFAYSVAFKVSASPSAFILSLLFPAILYIASGILIASIGRAFDRYQTRRLDAYYVTREGHRKSSWDAATPPVFAVIPTTGTTTSITSTTSDKDNRQMSMQHQMSPTSSSFSNYSLSPRHSVPYDPHVVEWTYCFDVHSNGVLPVVLICGVLQYFLLPVLLHPKFTLLSSLASNCLYAVAGVYYCYVAALGYSKLPFRSLAVVLFVYPGVIILVLLTLATLCNINLTRIYLAVFVGLFKKR